MHTFILKFHSKVVLAELILGINQFRSRIFYRDAYTECFCLGLIRTRGKFINPRRVFLIYTSPFLSMDMCKEKSFAYVVVDSNQIQGIFDNIQVSI